MQLPNGIASIAEWEFFNTWLLFMLDVVNTNETKVIPSFNSLKKTLWAFMISVFNLTRYTWDWFLPTGGYKLE